MVRPSFPCATSTSLTNDSSALYTPWVSKRRVYAVRIPLDELSAHARNQRAEYDTYVGYILGQHANFFTCLGLPINDFHQAEGTDAFSQFHLYVCSAFLVKWSAKLRQMDFQASLRVRLARVLLTHHFSGRV